MLVVVMRVARSEAGSRGLSSGELGPWTVGARRVAGLLALRAFEYYALHVQRELSFSIPSALCHLGSTRRRWPSARCCSPVNKFPVLNGVQCSRLHTSTQILWSRRLCDVFVLRGAPGKRFVLVRGGSARRSETWRQKFLLDTYSKINVHLLFYK